MADQKLILDLTGGRSIVITAKDSAGTAAEFDDIGGATVWTADATYQILAARGIGTTAPATALRLQPKINGNERSKYVNLPAVYDPKSNQEDRLGTLLGVTIPAGTSVQFLSR